MDARAEAHTAALRIELVRLRVEGLVAVGAGQHEQYALPWFVLMHVAPRTTEPASPAGLEPIRQARYCYGHLADELGTGLLAVMRRKGWLVADASRGFCGMSRKAQNHAPFGFEPKRAWRELCRASPAALAVHFTQLGWIERKKHARVVYITAAGAAQFKRLGIKLRA